MIRQTSTPNPVIGIKAALRLLKSLPDWPPQQAVFAMAHTGIYKAHLLNFLHKLHLTIWLASWLQIKKVAGRPVARTATS